MTEIESFNVRKSVIGNPSKLKKSSFNDLEDGDLYHDPFGKRAGRQVLAKSDFYDRYKESFEKFDEYQEKGFSVQESYTEVKKELDTSDWDLPIWFLPDVELVNPQMTPLADLLPREVTNRETIKVTQVLDGDEPSVNTDIESEFGDYSESSMDWNTLSYDVSGYNVVLGISDKLQLADDGLRNPRQAVENVALASIRQWEEEEIIQGSDDVFTSLVDESTESDTVDEANVERGDVRSLIKDARKAGANIDDLGIVTSFDAFEALQNDLDTYTRYTPMEEFDFGYETLVFDGVPVMPSHGFGDPGAGDEHTIAFNMGSSFMGMLMDSTIRPLARTGANERIAVDTYGAFVQEKPDHTYHLANTA